MSNKPWPQPEIVLCQIEDGNTCIQCRLESETLWLTQVKLAELSQTSVSNINLHLKAIYADGELSETATIKSYLMVQSEGHGRCRGRYCPTVCQSYWQWATGYTASAH